MRFSPNFVGRVRLVERDDAANEKNHHETRNLRRFSDFVDRRSSTGSRPADSRKIQVLSMETLALQKEFAGHRDGQSELTLSPDGNTLASAGLDQTVKLWDVATGEELLTLDGFRGPIWSLRFSPDGKALATFSGTGPNKPGEIRLWLAAEDGDEPAQMPTGGTANGESVKK